MILSSIGHDIDRPDEDPSHFGDTGSLSLAT